MMTTRSLLISALLCSLLQQGVYAEKAGKTDVTLLQVPGTWEEQAEQKFAKHDGYAWYRCYVKVPDRWAVWVAGQKNLWSESVSVVVGHVADACEIYVNGKRIGQAGSFPPKFEAVRDELHRFKVPPKILLKGQYNVIALRIYNKEGTGGFKGQAPVLAGYHNEMLLQGRWEFQTTDNVAFAIPAAKTKPAHAVYTEVREASSALQRPQKLVRGQRLSPAESLAKTKASADFTVDQVLADPLIGQPLWMDFDERGRMWLVQYRQYPFPAGLRIVSRDKYYRAIYNKVPQPPPNHDKGMDRISIHEDTNGDGVYDRHSNFLQGLNMTTAVARGRGGVWVIHSPYLLFYPDRDGDDVPDSNPEVHLQGFGLEDTHAACNGLVWGPDGWLYFAQGSTISSRVSDPRKKKSPSLYCEGAGIWRYHPETARYELFSEAGNNRFGLEFDSKGRLFSGHNGGSSRGYHFMQDSYLRKSTGAKYGQLSNPYAFGALPLMAHDPTSTPRFSHALVRYEETAFAKEYAGQIFSIDPLHRHIVRSEMMPDGSSYKTKDVGITMENDDIAFRPVGIRIGPDGGIYVADFYEQFIAHGQHYQGQIDPDSGRVYRIRPKGSYHYQPIDLGKKSSRELVELLNHPARWYRQTALRLIADRKDKTISKSLEQILQKETGQYALEAFWALNLIGELDDPLALQSLKHANPHVRSWTVRLLGDRNKVSSRVSKALVQLAKTETHPEVRSQLAASAKRLPADDCLPIAFELLKRDEDLNDPFIPMQIWWALEAHSAKQRNRIVNQFKTPAIWDEPLVKNHLLQRVMKRFATAGSRNDLLACANLFLQAPHEQAQQTLMSGFEEAFRGRPLTAIPKELAIALSKVGGGSLSMRVRQGDVTAVEEALKALAAKKTKLNERIELAQTLGEVREPKSVAVMLELLPQTKEVVLQNTMLTALQNFDQMEVAQRVIQLYSQFPAEVLPVAQSLLVSRKAWCRDLLQAVDQKKISPETLPMDVVRRMTIHQDPAISKLIGKHWASIDNASSEQMRNEISRVNKALQVSIGDPYQGRVLFEKTCAKCHKLFTTGGKIGPDLTPYKRDDTARMLVNIINPSNEIREGFESYVALTDEGRVVTGFMFDQDENVVVLRGADGQNVTMPRDSIEELLRQKKSLMPEGLTTKMTDQQLRDLFAYLRLSQPIHR